MIPLNKDILQSMSRQINVPYLAINVRGTQNICTSTGQLIGDYSSGQSKKHLVSSGYVYAASNITTNLKNRLYLRDSVCHRKWNKSSPVAELRSCFCFSQLLNCEAKVKNSQIVSTESPKVSRTLCLFSFVNAVQPVIGFCYALPATSVKCFSPTC